MSDYDKTLLPKDEPCQLKVEDMTTREIIEKGQELADLDEDDIIKIKIIDAIRQNFGLDKKEFWASIFDLAGNKACIISDYFVTLIKETED